MPDALASGLCGSGTSPLRHAGQTPAPTPTGDYRPALRSPWPAAKVGEFPIPLPGLTEQEAICAYLEKKLDEVKSIVTVIEAQIATLTAYMM